MIYILSLLFLVSLITNGILIWYIRKLINNLNSGVRSIDEFQKLLEEYCALMESVNSLDQYYGDDTINAAIKNTKVVIEAAKSYKKMILDEEDEEELIGNKTE